MNKKIFLLLPALGLLLCGCPDKGGNNVPPKPDPDTGVKAVEVDHDAVSLEVGQTFQLAASVKPITLEDRTYTWSSDAATVASVDASGMVTAIEEGTAHIRATANADTTKYAECTVTVTPEMVTVALTDPAAIMASTETLKFGCNQKNVGKYYFFTGGVDTNTRGETSESWAEGVQVKLESAGENKYYVTFNDAEGKKYFEMDDAHHYEIVATPTSGREWAWNSTYATVQRTIGEKTYLPGTYQTFTTISGCDLAQAASDFFFQFVYKTAPVAPQTISLSAASDKIYQGGTLQVEATLGPAGAKGNLNWTVTGDEHVSVSNKGLVSAEQEATLNASITVRAAYAEDATVYGELTLTVAEYINYGTLNEPLTIAQAKAIIDKFPTGTPEVAYVKGVVSSSGAYSTQYNNWDPIWLTDGEVAQAFEGYRLKDGSSDGSFKTTYAAANSLNGKTITLSGKLKKYNSTYENDGGNDSKLMKVEDIPVNPTSIVFNPAESFDIKQGGEKTVSASLRPYGATGTIALAVSPANQGVSYANGKVVAAADATVGNYTLTATCGQVTANLAFTVSEDDGSVEVTFEVVSQIADPSATYSGGSVQITSVAIDTNVTLTVNGGGNNGKVYKSNDYGFQARLYTGGGAITVTPASGYKIVSAVASGSIDDSSWWGAPADIALTVATGGASASYTAEHKTCFYSITVVYQAA